MTASTIAKRMLESHRDSAHQRVTLLIQDFETQFARMREAVEKGETVDASIMQHTAVFMESVGTHNTFKLVLDLLEAEAELAGEAK